MIMKKSYSFLMAAALVAGSLASCTVNDDIQTKSDNQGLKEIKFSAGDITRGEVYTSTAAPSDILVYAFKNASPATSYIDGATFTQTTGTYSCATTYYWPTGTDDADKLNFLALYPKELKSSSNFTAPTDAKTFSYIASTTLSEQYDVMAALAEEQLSTTSSGNVSLAFGHLLSQILFTGYVEEAANLKVAIKSISLHNIKTTGNATTGTALTAQSAIDTYTVTFDAAKELGEDADSPTELTSSSSNALLLIPQTGTAWNGTDAISTNDGESGAKGSYIEVELTAQNKTNNDYVVGSSDSPAKVYFPLTPNWTASKRHAYKLHFGDKTGGTDGVGKKDDGTKEVINATAITLTATVTDWTDAEASTIDF